MKKKNRHYKIISFKEFHILKKMVKIGVPWTWIIKASGRTNQTLWRVRKSKDIEEFRNNRLSDLSKDIYEVQKKID